MQLPPELRHAIDEEEEAAGVNLAQRVRAAEQLSRRYQQGDFRQPVLATGAHRIAYLQARMPATYAASCRVFHEIRSRLPDVELRSLLDLGAGPGTTAWA